MIEQITDGANFVLALIISVIIWGMGLALVWYYHLSDARRYYHNYPGKVKSWQYIPFIVSGIQDYNFHRR